MTLLADALERTLLEPQCARRWHALMAAWLAAGEPQAQRSVLDTLGALPDDDPRSDVLRLSFLAGASGEKRFENAASARALAVQPADPDRLAAFMAYRWLSALQHLETRDEFLADLSAGQLPEMARRLMQIAAQAPPPHFAPRAAREIRRVAVVVPYVGHRFHTPSMMAVEQCVVLARQGVAVRLFSAQELLPPDAALFRGDGRELLLPALDVQAWEAILPPGIDMTISDSRYSLPGRWRMLMPALAAYDPDVVLLVGLYSPLAAALHARRPTLGISANSVAPLAPLDVWLSGAPVAAGREAWGGVFAAPLPVYHPWRVRRAPAGPPLARAALGIAPGAVVWITAGFRLEHEIKGEWAAAMLQLMARHPEVVWLLVGGEGRMPQALHGAPPGRVRALATRKDLASVFRCCDIYVNPPRMGGGFSVAEAMAEGLPVTAFAGSDGGDKVGDLALADATAYLERLATLVRDRGLRAETGRRLQQRFGQWFDIGSSGPALVEACRLAAKLGSERLGA